MSEQPEQRAEPPDRTGGSPGHPVSGHQQPYPPAGPPGYGPGQPYPSGPPQWYGYPPYHPPAGTNGLAIASLVLGLIWIYWIGSILAVIFGHVALHQIKQNGQEGRGLAIAGVVLGYVGIGFAIGIGIIAVIAGIAAAP